MIFSWHCNTGFQLIFIWCIAEGKETMSLGNLWPQVYVKASREWEWLNQKWGPLGNLWFLGDNHGCLSCLQWSKPLGFWNKVPNYRQPPPRLFWLVKCGHLSHLQENYTLNHSLLLWRMLPLKVCPSLVMGYWIPGWEPDPCFIFIYSALPPLTLEVSSEINPFTDENNKGRLVRIWLRVAQIWSGPPGTGIRSVSAKRSWLIRTLKLFTAEAAL